MSHEPIPDAATRPDASGRVDPDDDTGQTLPPLPEPKVEPQAPPPGGPHAIEGVGGDGAYTTLSHDAPPRDNPATDHDMPAQTGTREDTDTEATEGRPDGPGTQETPA